MMVLGLSANELVARVSRLRIANDTPLAIERAVAVGERAARSGSGRRLALCGAREDRQPPGARRAAHLGRQSRRGRRARCSKCRPASASLNIERISYLASGKVIEFTRSIYRGDAYDFVAELRLGERPRTERRP